MAERSDDGERNDPRSSGRKPMAAAVAAARSELEALLGQRVERVSSATPEGEGWRMTVDAVELVRVPDSTSVLGSYEVLVDSRGHILEYQRTRRFYRNRADEEEW